MDLQITPKKLSGAVTPPSSMDKWEKEEYKRHD